MNRDVMFTMEITQLIERCKQGDADALGELYNTYAHRMKGVCRRYFKDEQTIEDVLHDAFLIIFTSLDKLRDNSKSGAWMMSITRNVASKYKEHLNALPTVPLEDAEMATMMETDERKDVRGVPLEEVIKLIDKMPEGYGKVFRLSVFEGMSHKEIAELLGIEPHSSSSQLVRAKRMLRNMMRSYWALLLLLLIPVGLFFFKKNPVSPAQPGKDVSQVDDKDTPEKDIRQVNENDTQEIDQKTLAEKQQTSPVEGDAVLPAERHLTVSEDTLRDSGTSVQHTQPQLQEMTAYAVDSVIPVDTISRMVAIDHQADTTQVIRNDSLQPSAPRYDVVDLWPDKPSIRQSRDGQWSVELAYSGQFDHQSPYAEPYIYRPEFDPSRQSSPISDEEPSYTSPSSIDNWSDYAVYLANNADAVSAETRSMIMRIALNNANQPGQDKLIRKSHHQLPVTWSLALKYRLNHRWGFETGLRYSKLSSDFELGDNGNRIEEHQTIHYLGIPVKAIYHLYGGPSWSLYAGAGLMTDIPLSAPLENQYYVNGSLEGTEKTKIQAPWQFSTTFGLGLQYHITPSIGLFAEPGLQYYIPTGSEVETYRTKHPFSFILPLGIRFTW